MSEYLTGNECLNVCRICMVERSTEGYEPFVQLMEPIDGKLMPRQLVLDLMKIDVEPDEYKPTVICHCCFVALDNFHKLIEKGNESQIVINYIAKKNFGESSHSMPGTSKASTSSMMLRNNEASSHSMPGTSTAPTSSLMLRNNEESSHKTSLKNYRSTSKRSNEFVDSMPGTSKASTSSIMLRNKKESSQEPPFKHSRLPSNKFGDSMPGTSTAPTSSLMLRNNEESSHKTSLKNYRSTSKRSNEFGDSMPGTSKASTSSMMLRNNEASSHSMPGTSKASTSSMKFRNNEESSHKTPFKNYRTTSKQSNEFGDSMPGTSTAYSSSPMLRNNEESYQELPSKHSRLLSKQPYKFGNSMPGTSSASSSSMLLVVDEELSDETPFKHSQSILKRSNKNGTTLNGRNNSNNYQGNSSRSVITKHLEPEFDDESDDDSCIIITNPTETVVLISDDEDHENENFENVDLSDNEESVELSQDEVIVLSSDSEGNENNIKKENVNKVTEKYFCSICRKKHSLHLNCSQYNKSYFTCLVPGCNILSKSKKDFIYHYQPHIGMSSSGVMCHHCFKGIDQSNIDGNGSHKYCDIKKAFKCYQCNIEHNNIHEFAHHKLKFHSGIFMDTHCNYLCLHCEESSEDKFEMIAHLNHCLESRAQNVTAASMKPKTATELFGIKKNVMVRRNGNKNMIPPTGHHVLFTCLKPSCNIIFQSFSNFKYHYRCHFELGNALVCWQCCKPCPDIPYLRAHQLKNNCRTPGMFKCYECPSKFNDLESLSIHKLTFHKGQLIAGKKNRKTIICAFCQTDIYIFNFQSHLATCQKKNSKNNTCTTKYKGEYTCLTCERVFASPISLSNHSRVHKGSRISNLKKEST